MKPLKRRPVPAQIAAILLASLLAASNPAVSAGIPVIDGANLSQNLISAIENVAHTLKQIQQYRTQLQQYENMLQNTTAPSQQIWDAANVTMNDLRASIDTLSHYKATLGSVDAYLRKFRDASAYQGSPCYSVNGCTQAQWDAMKEAERFGSQSQKRATEAVFKGLDRQQENLQVDASKLQQLQAAAQGANGQVQAIGYANQLASHQSNQLLQVRALLIAQQNLMATRFQAVADNEARQQAASDKHYRVPGPSNRDLDRRF